MEYLDFISIATVYVGKFWRGKILNILYINDIGE